MDISTSVSSNFHKDVYMPLLEAKQELISRRADPILMRKVKDFFGMEMFSSLAENPQAVLSRCIATPNLELERFLNLTSDIGLGSMILEYPDKFVAKNLHKYHLCKIFFLSKLRGSSKVSGTLKIADFNTQEGKSFKEIRTIWGGKIIDFHHQILYEAFPNLKENVLDFTTWFNLTRNHAGQYYLYFLALFICNGILFENFTPEDKEEALFIREKFLPSYREVEKIFGVKPLICELLPSKEATNVYWHSYPESMKDKIMCKIKQKVL